MWILPKNLPLSPTSPSVPDTEESTSPSKESLAEQCEQSLLARSKPSQSRTWLQRWKQGKFHRLLSGLTFARSLGETSMGLTYSAGVFLVNHSHRRGEVTRTPIRDTSSLPSSEESESQDLPLFSWKTSKESSARNSKERDGETLPELRFCSMSSENWKEWVTEQRREYSVRLKSAHLTNESEPSSWPTVVSSEARQGFQNRNNGKKGSQKSLTTVVIETQSSTPGPVARENPSTTGKPQGSVDWRTPCANEAGARVETLYTKNGEPARPGERAYRKQPDGKLVLQSQTINQQVDMVENWPTPLAVNRERSLETMEKCANYRKKVHNKNTVPLYLGDKVKQVEAWATPGAQNHDVSYYQKSGNNIYPGIAMQANSRSASKGKLNPRWVEHIMGLPAGWVSPDPVGPTESTSRVDELRLLGNGVVPQTAAVAFVTLAKRFES